MRVYALLVLVVVVLAAPALPATFTVSSTVDAPDTTPGDGHCDADAATADDQCTLRAAVQETNATPGPDTIVLPAGVYKLTRKGAEEDAGLTGDLDVTDVLTITGAAATATIVDGKKAKDRILDVHGAATVTGVTLRRGRAPSGETGGGAVRTAGTLTMIDVVLTRCRAVDDGGAVDVRSGSFVLQDSLVSRNRTGDDAGGIDVDGGTVELTRVRLEHNFARDDGGALENSGAHVVLVESQLTANRARSTGGGLANEDAGRLEVTRCTLVGNRAPIGAGVNTETQNTLGPSVTMVQDTSFSKNRRRTCGGPVVSLGGNTADEGSCGF